MTKVKLATQLTHTGNSPDLTLGAVNPVIQRASSIVFANCAAKTAAEQQPSRHNMLYGRHGTLTHSALKEALCALEQAYGCTLHPSGLAAISHSILACVKQGDHVLIADSVYAPTQDFCRQILANFGVSFTFFDPTQTQDFVNLIQPNTSVLFLENPTSISIEFYDAAALVAAAKQLKPQLIAIADNTYAAGVLFQPLKHGFDISIQSGSKYLIGHSDYLLGIACANQNCLAKLQHWYKHVGQCIDADSAYMALRGLRSLTTRLTQHYQNSTAVAQWLTTQPMVAQVNHPSCSSSPGQEFWQRDFSGGNGLFFFSLKQRLTASQLSAFIDQLSYIKLAYSWGGYESLILAYQSEQLQKARPASNWQTSGSMFRLHIGLEHSDDLIADLAAALARIAEN